MPLSHWDGQWAPHVSVNLIPEVLSGHTDVWLGHGEVSCMDEDVGIAGGFL